MTPTMTTTPAGTRSPTSLGEPRWFFGGLVQVRAGADDTGGRYTLVDVRMPAHAASPLHVHHREDEGFFVLEGSVTVHVGDRSATLAAGDHAFGPREIPHRFEVGPDGAHMLWVLTPGGFEALVEEASVRAAAPTLPPADVLPPADIDEIVRRHGNEILG
jgi:mannose-6-phosphate isomerase-like protein (cupin superfamily)